MQLTPGAEHPLTRAIFSVSYEGVISIAKSIVRLKQGDGDETDYFVFVKSNGEVEFESIDNLGYDHAGKKRLSSDKVLRPTS